MRWFEIRRLQEAQERKIIAEAARETKAALARPSSSGDELETLAAQSKSNSSESIDLRLWGYLPL